MIGPGGTDKGLITKLKTNPIPTNTASDAPHIFRSHSKIQTTRNNSQQNSPFASHRNFFSFKKKSIMRSGTSHELLCHFTTKSNTAIKKRHQGYHLSPRSQTRSTLNQSHKKYRHRHTSAPLRLRRFLQGPYTGDFLDFLLIDRTLKTLSTIPITKGEPRHESISYTKSTMMVVRSIFM